MCSRASEEMLCGMWCGMLCRDSRPRLSGRAKLDFLLASPGTLMPCHEREALQRRVQVLTWKRGASAPRTSANKDWGFSPGNSPNNNRSNEP